MIFFTRYAPVYIFFLLLFGHDIAASCDKQVVQDIKREFAQKYKAHKPDPIIEKIAKEALAQCKITDEVIILQSNSHSNSYVVANSLKHPQQFMIIGTAGLTLDAIEGNIYHEAGHIAHQDVSLKKKLEDIQYSKTAKVASIVVGFLGGFGFQNYIKKNRLLASLVGGFSMLTTFCAASCYKQYKESIKEARADAYAYKKLIEHNKLNTALGYLADFISDHEHNNFNLKRSELPAFLTGYPPYLERAKIGLDVLEQKGFNIADLMNNLPPDLDKGLRIHLPGKIKEYFPEKF